MKLLIKQVYIADTTSPHYGLVRDILIINGKISSIEATIEVTDCAIVAGNGLVASQGFTDIFADFADPGFEQRETLETGAAAALAGGYTHVLVVPNTRPVTDNKTAVEYIAQKAKTLPVHVHPLGAISKKTEGKELAEMYDMHQSGALAFTDGLLPLQSPGLLLKALQYVKALDATIIQLPLDRSIASGGLMHEGVMSTQLGLPGIPSLSEQLIISRDLDLLQYTDSKLHITGVSTKEGLQLIREAKARGLRVSCSVTPHHLFFCDEDLTTYDTNLKTSPPLRSRQDMLALRDGVTTGIVDCIATHHQPQDWDSKTCEFEYAQPGMIGLETAFAVVNEVLPTIGTTRVVELFSNNARTIFSIPQTAVMEGSDADITIFSRETATDFDASTSKSKSRNSPFHQKTLSGKIIACINKEHVYLNK